MVVAVAMFVLFGIQLLFILSASRYLKALSIGLTLFGMLTSEQIPTQLKTSSSKANKEYVGWNAWRTGAIVSLIATAALWWGFSTDTAMPILFLMGSSLGIGWTLTSGWNADFNPKWAIEWHGKLIRTHDLITMNYIHERMLVIADQLEKRDNGELTLTSVEESTIEYEVVKMAELLMSISRRNPDLIKPDPVSTSKG